MASKRIYFFEPGKAEGTADMKDLLGGKGANLAEMANLGIPVPPGFTITTEMCTGYYKNHAWPEGLEEDVRANLSRLEKTMGKDFGDPENPLLVSVRSGARASMPGMMDTILNLGLNDAVAEGLVRKTGNPRFVYDSYRRFIQMYSDVVLEISRSKFETLIDARKQKKGVKLDTELDAQDWEDLVGEFKAVVQRELGHPFPEKPWEQLVGAINAVFRSWNNNRAITYRKLNDIPDWWGTAVNVQTMVFGNMGETSGTGVAFTRDARTGERKFFGEYLMNAQGEDVVAGIRTPHPVSQLEQTNSEAYRQLTEIYEKLEKHYRDMMDIEFTIQEGRLYMLQCRVGKRTAMAAVRMAVEMVKEGLIDRETAVLRVTPKQIDELLHPIIDPKAKVKGVAKGLPASPGAAVGKVVFHAKDAEKWVKSGEKRVILVRTETSPEDVGGMNVAQGILTARGGMTSHAAVVARGMGKCCVAGCEAIRVNEEEKYFTVGEVTVREGDWLTLNGTTGEVILGETSLVEPALSGDFATLMDWAEACRPVHPRVRANADTPMDARVARDFGAEGIGLCRTEHMFFAGDRIKAVREMILADDAEERKKPLAKIMPMQKGDFKEIFREMKDLPVTIRLLDPPLHEFLPHEEDQQRALAEEMGKSFEEIHAKVRALAELNPMLGHRGCRLGVTFPEIYDMQVQAIFEAACELAKEGLKVVPEVMIPLVGIVKELAILKQNAIRVAEEVMQRYGVRVEYSIGTMIEVPRAALLADAIAKEAAFFSFGTNDLTQMTFGYSRDDAGKFLPVYIDQGVLEKDPFQSIDQEGVGQLVKMGVEKGRATNPTLKCGVCGEHGGDPASIFFFHKVGLDYVSCSPYRVPVARMATAHAELKAKKS